MNRKIILLTGDNGFFGQTRKPWVSIDIKHLIETLVSFNFEVEVKNFNDIANTDKPPQKSIVFYTFSQKENLRFYLKTVVQYLHNLDNIIIPDYNLLLCHENKGYQELYKKNLGITDLHSYYFSKMKYMEDYDIKFPLVLKTVYGSNGKGVFLVKDKQDIAKHIKSLKKRLPFFQWIDLLRRHFLRHKKNYPGYPNFSAYTDYKQYKDYLTPEIRYILQEFIPNLRFDYRVIVLWEKYYVIKRLNRENDFRASGAKRFVLCDNIPDKLLDYSRTIFNKFATPFLSLDIGEAEGKFYLFEYQALHFGINCIILSDGFYRHRDNKWVFVSQKPDFEASLGEGLAKYLEAALLSNVNDQ